MNNILLIASERNTIVYLNSPSDPHILVSRRISGVNAFIVNDAVAPPSKAILTTYYQIT